MLRFSDWVSRMRRMDPPEPEPVIPAERWEEMARAAIEAQTEERRAFAVLREEVKRVSAGLAVDLDTEGARMALERALDMVAAERDSSIAVGVVTEALRGVRLAAPLDEVVRAVLAALADAGLLTPGEWSTMRAVVDAPDDQRRDPVPDGGVVALINANPRLDGGPKELLAAIAGLHATLGDEREPHMCTCGHVPEKGIIGCSEGFGDRCRFEMAIRQVLGR